MICPTCSVPSRYQAPRLDFFRIQQKRIYGSIGLIGVSLAVTAVASVTLFELGMYCFGAGAIVGVGSLAMHYFRPLQYRQSRNFWIFTPFTLVYLDILAGSIAFSFGGLALAAGCLVISCLVYKFFSSLQSPLNTSIPGNSDTFLTSAIKTNRTSLVKLALYLSADPNQKVLFNGNLVTPLQIACHYGNRLSIVHCLLRNHANPNDQGSFSSPLHLAVENSDAEIALLLLHWGALCQDSQNSDSIGVKALELYISHKILAIEVEKTKLLRNGFAQEMVNKMIIDVEEIAHNRALQEGETLTNAVILKDSGLLTKRRLLSLLAIHQPHRKLLSENLAQI